MGRRASLIVVAVVLLLMVMYLAVGYSDGDEYGLACDASACRSGIANDGCCRAIKRGIQKGTCTCMCVFLNPWEYSNLPAKCSSTGRCKSCSICNCQKIDHPFPISSI